MSKKHDPKVSVIMATYNDKPEQVQKAAESILSQSFSDLELLILDDSTDSETRNAIDRIGEEPRVEVIRREQRMGLSGARNVGLEHAKGELIAIMDGDDISLPDRLRLQTEYLMQHPKVYVLGGQMDIINEEDEKISERRYPLSGFRLKRFAAYRNPIAHPTVMFRKELFDKGFRYDESLEMSEDLDLWLRIMNAGYEIQNLNETLIRYRISSDFTEKRTSQKQKNYMAMVRKKNWSSSNFFFSLASVTAGSLFRITPGGALKGFYKKENRQ